MPEGSAKCFSRAVETGTGRDRHLDRAPASTIRLQEFVQEFTARWHRRRGAPSKEPDLPAQNSAAQPEDTDKELTPVAPPGPARRWGPRCGLSARSLTQAEWASESWHDPRAIGVNSVSGTERGRAGAPHRCRELRVGGPLAGGGDDSDEGLLGPGFDPGHPARRDAHAAHDARRWLLGGGALYVL